MCVQRALLRSMYTYIKKNKSIIYVDLQSQRMRCAESTQSYTERERMTLDEAAIGIPSKNTLSNVKAGHDKGKVILQTRSAVPKEHNKS
jgi:hypothetical protein